MDDKSSGHQDPESQVQAPKRSSHFRMVFDQTLITQQVLEYNYSGDGTVTSPFIVEFLPVDERNPMLFRESVKWGITFIVSMEALAVALVSSAYAPTIPLIRTTFNTTVPLTNLGLSLFVLGFALGPLIWGPLSELYGRQALFIITYIGLTAFNAGAAFAPNMPSLLVCRFLAGSFGASPLTNSGGVISDMFTSARRGYAVYLFAVGPYLGPALGPLFGGTLGQRIGWRWVEGAMALFTGAVLVVGGLTVPETYGPVILRRRAARLTKLTGKIYVSVLELKQSRKSAAEEIGNALTRPWVLLFQDPIVFVASIYMAIVYGSLYMTFLSYPIVYQQKRHWSSGKGSLPFLSLAIGTLVGLAYLLKDNARYIKALRLSKCLALPEARLPPVMVGGVCLPISLFWFAWSNAPTSHWSISVLSIAFFGFGMTLVFLGIIGFLVDSYVIYAASVLAASGVLRSLFGAASPLFTTYMYNKLGIHWASSIPAFLVLMCVPFPFLMYKYGLAIRMKCKHSAAAAKLLEQLRRTTIQREEQAEQAIPKEEQR